MSASWEKIYLNTMSRIVNWSTLVFFFFFGGEKKQWGERNWEIGTDTREDPLEEESAPTPVFSPGEPQGQRSLQATVQGSQTRTQLKGRHFHSHKTEHTPKDPFKKYMN